ncbi:MAG: RNA polymerase sigma factor [Gemmatimonadetes bacterium]|nr:MAG: RNA polymerase sigma factor [Gemmatimonadota bacterium]
MSLVDHFSEALKPHYSEALTYCRSLCARFSAEEAEDVLQQALLKAYEKFNTLRDPTRFKPWLFQIITNEFHSVVRRHFWKRFLPLEFPATDDENLPKMPPVYDRAESDETKLMLRQALSSLSDKERAAILLFEIAGFSIEEIQHIQQEKSASTIKSRLSRARRKMRRRMTAQESQRLHTTTFKPLIGDIEHETLQLVAKVNIDGRLD